MPRKNEGLTAEGQKRSRKADISKNGLVDLEESRKRDEGKVCLRIDVNTVISVSSENKNEGYVTRFRNRVESL